MTAYSLLSTPIKKFIRDKKWEEFRPIQKAAIVKILSSEDNYILAARTASGKTEAAFLPILSKIDFTTSGVQVLYISPLIALINDQFQRVNELCKYLDVNVTKWHGEASRAAKHKLIKNPNGILLITPESIEAMFVNQPHQIAPLFKNLEFIIIDEIHSFLGNHRGVQLKSLLSRISNQSNQKLRFIGLSATLGDYYDSVKTFFGPEKVTRVLRDNTPQNIESSIEFYESEGKQLPVNLLKRLYIETQQSKTLIFPNSRGRVEEIAVKLKKIGRKNNGHTYYYAHHSSVNRELREFIENFVKTNKRYNYAIACTSTLELGIDIGSVDLVAQIDATFSVASLAQRLGRSGRKEGTKSKLLLCATDQWALLQSIACFQLLQKGFVEPLVDISFPIDILFHQILSIVQEKSGINKDVLFQRISHNHTFQNISKEEIITLLRDMIQQEYLENINGELISGIGAERLISGRIFYTVFQTPDTFKVISKNKVIGEVPPSNQIVADQNIYLAAKMWKIEEVDISRKKVYVIQANDGKKPIFFGTGGVIHARIRQQMLSILSTDKMFENCTETAQEQINDLKYIFKKHLINDVLTQRPIFLHEDKSLFFTFTSTKINRTLFFVLKHIMKVPCQLFEQKSLLEFPQLSLNEFQNYINRLLQSISKLDSFLKIYLIDKENEFSFSKWAIYLSLDFKHKILLTEYFDVMGAATFLNHLNIVAK